jgi:hypothetical protein
MKNKWFLFPGILVVFGLVFVSCDNGSNPDSDSLDGIWEVTVTGSVINRVTISGNDWTLAVGPRDSLTETNKGTLHVEDKTITLTATHQKTSANGDWVAYSRTRTGVLSDDGKSFVMQEATFVKK